MAYPKHIERINWKDVPFNERGKELAGIISEFVNGVSSDYTSVADELARDHRYLQGEEFKLALEIILALAHNHAKGWFDPRNEFACKMATAMVKGLDNADMLAYYDKDFALEGKERRKW
jgi:hypothetical protein